MIQTSTHLYLPLGISLTMKRLPSIVGSFSTFYLPAVLQLPQLIIPGMSSQPPLPVLRDLTLTCPSLVGQKPYESRISGLKEYLPIVSSFMGAKGSDVMLINLAEAVLTSAKWPTEVRLGREMFKVGDNIRNVL